MARILLALSQNGVTGWKVYTHLKQTLESEVVRGPDASASALRITIPASPTLKKFQIGLSQPIANEIPVDQLVTVHFMARSPENLKIGAMIHTVAEPHRNKFYQDFELGPDWQSYEAVGKKKEAFKAGEAALEFFVAFSPGHVEISKKSFGNGSPKPKPAPMRKAFYSNKTAKPCG